MNREEAIKVFEEIKLNYDTDPDWGVYDGEFNRRNITEILDAYAVLLNSHPDPATRQLDNYDQETHEHHIEGRDAK